MADSSVGTLIQFAAALRDAFFRDPDNARAVARKEYDAYYPPESRTPDWVGATWASARRGETLHRLVLDDLARRCGEPLVRSLAHDYPSVLPDGYLLPSIRAWNDADHQKWVAVRKRGRRQGEGEER